MTDSDLVRDRKVDRLGPEIIENFSGAVERKQKKIWGAHAQLRF